MIYTVLQKIFSVIISILVLFSSLSSGGGTQPLDEKAVRVHYADEAHTYYDMFIPENPARSEEVILLIHGGAWMMGDQTMFERNAKEATEKCKCVSVTVDYSTLTEGANALDMENEILLAVQSVKDELASRGIRAKRMAVVGHSAGAHLALLYSYKHYTDSPIDIAFVMANSAPSDFFDADGKGNTTLEQSRYLLTSFLAGQPVLPKFIDKAQDRINEISPINYVSPSVPPTFLVHGDADEIVPYSNSVNLYNKLKENHVKCEFLTYPNGDHFLSNDPESDYKRADYFMKFAELYLY